MSNAEELCDFIAPKAPTQIESGESIEIRGSLEELIFHRLALVEVRRHKYPMDIRAYVDV